MRKGCDAQPFFIPVRWLQREEREQVLQSRDHKSAVERGIEIARSGKAANVSEVQEQLRAEGYGKTPLRAHGNELRRTINEICARATKGR